MKVFIIALVFALCVYQGYSVTAGEVDCIDKADGTGTLWVATFNCLKCWSTDSA